MTDERKGYFTDYKAFPADFPTHLHSAEFWEELGRTVATFGFLEETLGKAIFALTGTREYAEDEIDEAYEKWLPTLKKAISDPLGSQIDLYAKALREHGKVGLTNADELIEDLREAARIRNVLCHGSWRKPDDEGRSVPFFITSKMMLFNTPIDVAYLRQTRAYVVELIAAVVNSVTTMGWQFPGSSGPGEVVFAKRPKASS